MEKIERRFNAINVLFDYSLGTIWRVEEDLIIDTVKHYDTDSTRKGHPHISLQETLLAGIDKIPMLLGTSKKRHSQNFKVTGIMTHEEYVSWFGSIVAPYSVLNLGQKIVNTNLLKKRVAEKEKEKIFNWMKVKGFKYDK